MGNRKVGEHMFDHTYLIAADDPHKGVFYELEKKGLVDLRLVDAERWSLSLSLSWI